MLRASTSWSHASSASLRSGVPAPKMDLLFDLLFNNPYVPWVLGAVVLLVVYQKFGDRLKIRLPGNFKRGFVQRLCIHSHSERRVERKRKNQV